MSPQDSLKRPTWYRVSSVTDCRFDLGAYCPGSLNLPATVYASDRAMRLGVGNALGYHKYLKLPLLSCTMHDPHFNNMHHNGSEH